ncbi:MAG: nitroreductase family protein [Dehalococcoidia bacterium]
MDVFQAINERRSIRKYKPDPVSDDDLNAVLEAARWAPSWGNTQCWKFVVVRDERTRQRLADTLASTRAGRDNPGSLATRNAPVVVVACAELGRSGFKTVEEERVAVTDKGDWYMYDVALAMQNLVLAAHALGLGTVHIGAFDAEAAARVVAAPQGTVVVSLTPLGYPEDVPQAPRRKEPEEFIFRECFE